MPIILMPPLLILKMVGWLEDSSAILKINDTLVTHLMEPFPEILNYFSLSENYPNPFNPVTSIQYVVGSQSYVTLKVYDVLGNEIVTFVNEEKPTGNYEINWNADKPTKRSLFLSVEGGRLCADKKDGVDEVKEKIFFIQAPTN